MGNEDTVAKSEAGVVDGAAPTDPVSNDSSVQKPRVENTGAESKARVVHGAIPLDAAPIVGGARQLPDLQEHAEALLRVRDREVATPREPTSPATRPKPKATTASDAREVVLDEDGSPPGSADAAILAAFVPFMRYSIGTALKIGVGPFMLPFSVCLVFGLCMFLVMALKMDALPVQFALLSVAAILLLGAALGFAVQHMVFKERKARERTVLSVIAELHSHLSHNKEDPPWSYTDRIWTHINDCKTPIAELSKWIVENNKNAEKFLSLHRVDDPEEVREIWRTVYKHLKNEPYPAAARSTTRRRRGANATGGGRSDTATGDQDQT